MQLAVDDMVDFMHELKGWDMFRTMPLASMAVDFRITQIVDGTKGIHAMIPKSLFVNDKTGLLVQAGGVRQSSSAGGEATRARPHPIAAAGFTPRPLSSECVGTSRTGRATEKVNLAQSLGYRWGMPGAFRGSAITSISSCRVDGPPSCCRTIR